MKTTLTPERSAASREALRRANAAFSRVYPGESASRQPVHTVYGGAHLFRSTTARKMGDLALAALREDAPDSTALAHGLGLPQRGGFAQRVHARVVEKLEREPVEDFRIDFEDGYGHRPDAEEDAHAVSAAAEVARGLQQGSLPPFIGIRVKSFTEELYARASRTLDLFVTSLLEHTGGRLPPSFVVTLPKVTVPEQVTALAHLLSELESTHGLTSGALTLELMVETPQALFDARGRPHLLSLVEAGRGPLLPRAPGRLRQHRRPQRQRARAGHAPPRLRLPARHRAGAPRGHRRAAKRPAVEVAQPKAHQH